MAICFLCIDYQYREVRRVRQISISNHFVIFNHLFATGVPVLAAGTLYWGHKNTDAHTFYTISTLTKRLGFYE